MHLLEFTSYRNIYMYSGILGILGTYPRGLHSIYYEKQLQEEIVRDPFSNPQLQKI